MRGPSKVFSCLSESAGCRRCSIAWCKFPRIAAGQNQRFWIESNNTERWLHHIQPGKPTQNAYVERFNRSFRHEVFDAHIFGSPSEVRDIAHEWMTSYNEERPMQPASQPIPPTPNQPRNPPGTLLLKSGLDGEAYSFT